MADGQVLCKSLLKMVCIDERYNITSLWHNLRSAVLSSTKRQSFPLVGFTDSRLRASICRKEESARLYEEARKASYR